ICECTQPVASIHCSVHCYRAGACPYLRGSDRRTHGHPYFDNRKTVYTGALPQTVLDTINATVQRFDASPSALQYLDRNYEPSGDLRIPMLMLSIAQDPEAPRLHPLAYLNAVAATGSSGFLVQREINRYGHCNFEPAELAAAFTDLARWVELGIKPTA